MAEQNQIEQQTNPLSCIAKAPGVVFLLVAAADGRVDAKEVKQFEKLLQSPEYEILIAAMQEDGNSIMQLLADLKNNQLQPIEELKQLRFVLDSCLPEEMAMAYKIALIKLAKGIAEASGGLFGIFGSKISKQEKVVLAIIASELGLFGDETQHTEAATSPQVEVPQVEVAQHQYASAIELPDHLYPVLKSAEWAEDAKNDVVMRSIYADNEICTNEPVVGYALDLPETIEFLSTSSVETNLSIDAIHDKALQNLNKRLLAETEWYELNQEVPKEFGGTVTGLVLSGDYFSSEALLSKELLQIAHQKLDAAMIMVIAPERGKLFVTQIISEGDQPEPGSLLFACTAVAHFFNPSQAPISPNVWIVRNGRLVGQVKGMDGIIDSAKKYAKQTKKQEEQKLTHSANTYQEGNGISVKIAVVAHDIDIMLSNLQHVIRGYVKQAIQEQQFNGSMTVSVNIKDPNYAPEMKHQLMEQLEDMSDYLSSQFASLGMVCVDNTQINLSCSVEG
jgi:hypothetical protein